MKCKKCGEEIQSNDLFCGICGEQIEATKEQLDIREEGTVKEEPIKVEEETKKNQVEVEAERVEQKEPIEDMMEDTKEAVAEDGKKKKKKIMMYGIMGIVLIGIIYLMQGVLKMDGDSSGAGKKPFLYMDHDDLYIMYHDDKDGTRLIKDYETDGRLVMASEEKLYYTDDFTLYYKSGSKEAVEIAEDVYGFYVGHVMNTVIYYDDDETMYYYDGGEPIEIIDDVYDIIEVEFSPTGKEFVVSYYDDNYDDYLLTYKKGKVEEISDEVTSIQKVTEQYVYYLEEDGYSEYDVYRADFKGDTEKLFSFEGVDIAFNEEGNKAIYLDEDKLMYFDGDDSEEIADEIIMFELVSEESLGLIAANEDDDLMVWSEGDKELTEVLELDDFNNIDYTEDLKHIIVSDEDDLIIYTLKGKKYKKEKIDLKNITRIELLYNDKELLILDEDGVLYTYTIGDKEAEEIAEDVTYYHGFESNNLMIVIDEDELYYYNGKKLSEVGGKLSGYFDVDFEDSAKSYSYTDKRDRFYFGEKGKEAEEIIKDVTDVINYDNEYYYILDEDNKVYLYKAKGKSVKDLDVEADEIMSYWLFW